MPLPRRDRSSRGRSEAPERVRLRATTSAVFLAVLGAPARADEAEPPRTVLFGSFDAGPSSFLNVGFKRALGPSLDRDGWLALGSAGTGVRRERFDFSLGEQRATRLSTLASALIGYQWTGERVVFALFGGVELDHKQVIPDGVLPVLAEPRFGGRVQAELWWHPTEATLTTATLVAGSAHGHVWGRVAWGHEVWRGVYAGPELVGYAQDDYREGRIGLHLTGAKLGDVTLGVSAGGSFAETGPGGYVTLSGHIRM